MIYSVVFAPEALDQLVTLRDYLRRVSGRDVADAYVDAIVTHCERLGTFPHAGTPRDDLRPGLRTAVFKKRVVIAYASDDARRSVVVLGVFYGGQDFEALLTDTQP